MSILVSGNNFNTLQSRIQSIYGPPVNEVTTTGYAQTVRSSQVEPLVVAVKSFDSTTDVNYATSRITINSHGITSNDIVQYDSNNNPNVIDNLNNDSHYYVKVIDSNTIELYYDDTLNSIVNLVSGSSGTHLLNLLDGDVVTSEDVFDLYLDIASARIHQVGNAYTVPESAAIQVGDKIFENYFTDLQSLMTSIESDQFLIANNQLVIENIKDGTGTNINSSRSSPWNGTITHEFNVNFQTQSDRTAFFNSGGEIRISANLVGGSGLKTNDWRNILSNSGTVTFSRTGVSASGTQGTVTSVTPYNLTTSYSNLFTNSGASYISNLFSIAAKRTGTTTLTFRVSFADNDTGTGTGLKGSVPIDEDVDGTISTNISMLRPSGTFEVNEVSYNSVSFEVSGLNLSTL